MTTIDDSTSPATEALRAEIEAWLRDHLPADWVAAIDADDGEALDKARAKLDQREFLRTIGAAGWAMPAWPEPYGGKGLAGADVAVVEELKSHYQVPRSFNILGFGLAAPTLMQWGSEELKRYFLPLMAQGDVWCQLFSEPGNGSDVAGLATRAVRDGDEWVINGQKVWTSGAQMAKWGMLIARSNPDQPKHKGITYFVADMKAPGVDVRPLRQMTGDAEFNEVFLSDVRIPDAWRVGPEGEGWAVAQTTLMNERVALSGAFGAGGGAAGARGRGRGGAGGGSRSSAGGSANAALAALAGGGIDDLVRRAKQTGAWADPVLRHRLIQLFIEGRVASYTRTRAVAQRAAGGQPGPEGSIGKLFQAEYNQRLQNLAVDLLGTSGMAWSRDDGTTALRIRGFLRSRGNTIEGGTSEIQRNILGDRVLGLLREPDVSRDLPWKDVPRN